jgi:hypothetical protein
VSKMRVLLAVPPEHREGDPRALELVWHDDSIKVSIRGSGIQSDAIAGLELLIDGIPLNQADGEAFLHDIDLHSAQYAEVSRGADAMPIGWWLTVVAPD